MTVELFLVATGPVIAVGSLVWRLSARLAVIGTKLEVLERENRQLREEIGRLEQLVAILVDKGRPLP